MGAQESSSTVLITGGTDGLGRAMALLLAEQGYRVFATGRDAARREALAQTARERKLPLETVEMDVTDDASVNRALAEVRALAGPLDALINNAGFGVYAVVEELKLEDFRRQFETNFYGVLRVTQRVLPEMREQRRGRIVNISSIAGKLAIPLFGAYSASKHALEGMTDALRLEVYPFGIHVALIEPGYIPTGFQSVAHEVSDEYVARAEKSPYAAIYRAYAKRVRSSDRAASATPEDCARVALRALRETPPKARYTVTPQARWASLGRRLLTDQMFDRQIIKRFGLDRVKKELESQK
jgi:NAD(P)-dependent dehydrogenase (short-subunit alcohol dehydrogenase family)